jgi:hypothetical protein
MLYMYVTYVACQVCEGTIFPVPGENFPLPGGRIFP